ncbi:MAG TPA: pyridoxal-phosphate dependent enzyme [Acidimicrobiales bacterium]|nr:pyridoxal-phosphate dependent enzyme [Acidimicrobiales bacterium]
MIAARQRIAAHLPVTPTRNYPALDRRAGCEVWVKHENHQPVGAFKVRGGVNLVACLSDAERQAGVLGASTGNHGLSIAFAAKRFGVGARIFVPDGANPVKVGRIGDLGAQVVVGGTDFDEARQACADYAAEHGGRYIHSGDEPLLIAGVATETVELLEAAPELDAIVVPVGGGSGAAGAVIAAAAMSPRAEVIGVQSEAARTAHDAWRAGERRSGTTNTFAEGLATRESFDLPQQILKGGLHDFVLVSDDEICAAMLVMIETTQNLVEGAGAAALAAVLRYPDRFAGRKVGVIASGGNVTVDQLRAIL